MAWTRSVTCELTVSIDGDNEDRADQEITSSFKGILMKKSEPFTFNAIKTTEMKKGLAKVNKHLLKQLNAGRMPINFLAIKFLQIQILSQQEEHSYIRCCSLLT